MNIPTLASLLPLVPGAFDDPLKADSIRHRACLLRPLSIHKSRGLAFGQGGGKKTSLAIHTKTPFPGDFAFNVSRWVFPTGYAASSGF